MCANITQTITFPLSNFARKMFDIQQLLLKTTLWLFLVEE